MNKGVAVLAGIALGLWVAYALALVTWVLRP